MFIFLLSNLVEFCKAARTSPLREPEESDQKKTTKCKCVLVINKDGYEVYCIYNINTLSPRLRKYTVDKPWAKDEGLINSKNSGWGCN